MFNFSITLVKHRDSMVKAIFRSLNFSFSKPDQALSILISIQSWIANIFVTILPVEWCL